jgi:hypothetical protein
MKYKTSVKEEIVRELHKPARKNFKRRRVVLKGLNDLYQADLVEMIPYAKLNKGFRYILIVINAFSKYVWASPVKRKTGEEVAHAMENILSQQKIPTNLQTDMGKEFYNKQFNRLMVKFSINHYSTYSTTKSSIVERVNRTFKKIMWEKFSVQGSYKWLTLLPKIVKQYNSTKHRTTGFKPNEINSKNEKKILNTVYNYVKTVDKNKSKFKKGDYVRISKYRGVFDKGYTPNWSTEIFTIDKVKLTNPTTYILNDMKGEEIIGGFYGLQLQKVKHPDIYLVEKTIKRKGDKVLVKWLGLDKTHNSWIHKSNVM